MTPGETLSPKKEYFLMMNCRDYLYTAIDGRESYIQLFKVKGSKVSEGTLTFAEPV